MNDVIRYVCGHMDTPEKVVGDPPYEVPIPSNGTSLCPPCFLASCHQDQFLAHEHRLNLGPLSGEGDVWLALLLRQREVLRYEHQLHLRIDLSEAGKQRVWAHFLERLRAISRRYPPCAWQAFLPAHERAYQDMQAAFLTVLLHEQLSGTPVPRSDGLFTLKVVDLAPIEEGSAQRVALRTLDEWSQASAQGPLVLVCRKTILQRSGLALVRQTTPERIGYLVEDPVSLHLLWQATFSEFRYVCGTANGRLTWGYAERPIYRIAGLHIYREQRFMVKAYSTRFGLQWLYHNNYLVETEPLLWVDELWERGGVPTWLSDLADVQITDAHTWYPERKPEEGSLCLVCACPFDPSQSEVRNPDGFGSPEFCSARCFAATRQLPYDVLYAQRVQRRQGKALIPLGNSSSTS